MEEATSPESSLFNLSDVTQRTRYLEEHPIKNREYLLPTPMLRAAYDAIKDRVWARGTGLVFMAPPRSGKTRCAIATMQQICDDFPNATVCLLTARRASRGAAGHIYKLILRALGHVTGARTNEDLLFENLITDIRVQANTKGGRQFILFIDELQLLNNTDLEQLFCLHNALDLHKVRMTTVSFAQPEIVQRRTALMASNDRQIIARFLAEMRSFHTCLSSAELFVILEGYDEKSEYPEGSGWSYTRFFLPLAFAAGFRLSAHSQLIWKYLKAVGGDEYPVPMEHLCLSIENLLMMSWAEDSSSFTLTEENVKAAVESSGLRNFNQVFGDDDANDNKQI